MIALCVLLAASQYDLGPSSPVFASAGQDHLSPGDDRDAVDPLSQYVPPNRNLTTRSVETMHRHIRTYSERDIQFKLDVQLTFCDLEESKAYFQQGEIPFVAWAKPSLRQKLAALPVGTRLLIKGRYDGYTLNSRIESFEVHDRIRTLSPIELPYSELASELPLNRYCRVSGVIREALVHTDHVELGTSVDGHRMELRIYSPVEPVDVDAWVGRTMTATGVIVYRNNGPAPSRQILMMRPSQLTALGSESAPMTREAESRPNLESETVEITGIVLFSNGTSKIAIADGVKHFAVHTHFAHAVPPGTQVHILGRGLSNKRSGLLSIDSRRMEVIGQSKLPSPVAVELPMLRQRRKMPDRMIIKGHLSKLSIREQSLELQLMCKGEVVHAIVSTMDDPSFRHTNQLQIGSVVSVVGMPSFSGTTVSPQNSSRLHAASTNKNRLPRLKIYVDSTESVQVLNRPVPLFPWQIGVAVVSVVFFFLLGALWNHVLRRKVARRTQDLQETTLLLENVIQASEEAILVTDHSELICHQNQRFLDLFGFSPDARSSFAQLTSLLDRFSGVHSSWYEICTRLMKSESEQAAEEVYLPNQSMILRVTTQPIETSARSFYGRLWSFEDITQQRRMQAQFCQDQKSKALDKLSCGIAHDFNNHLTVIRSSLYLLDDSSTSRNEKTTHLKLANVAVDRAADLTHQLLRFSQKALLDRVVISANLVLDEVSQLVSPSLGADSELRIKNGPHDAVVQVDPNQLQQALINLVLNAIDATRPAGGVITLGVRRVSHAKIGDAVEFVVRDNGVGMTDETLTEVFQPFFTTKQLGEGSGLGLSVVQGIVKQHDGLIEIDSEAGWGTEFRVLLPRCSDAPSEAAQEIISKPCDRRSLNLLLVDDDPMILQTVSDSLRKQDQKVTTASNGMRALCQLASDGPFDAVILDLTMPEMSGAETFHEIRSAWQDQPVVFCSGYSSETDELNSIPIQDRPPFLTKPIDIEKLLDTLHTICQRSSDASTRVIDSYVD